MKGFVSTSNQVLVRGERSRRGGRTDTPEIYYVPRLSDPLNLLSPCQYPAAQLHVSRAAGLDEWHVFGLRDDLEISRSLCLSGPGQLRLRCDGWVDRASEPLPFSLSPTHNVQWERRRKRPNPNRIPGNYGTASLLSGEVSLSLPKDPVGQQVTDKKRGKPF